MAEILFKDNRVQTGYRVKLPKAIIDTLDLKSGEKIVIKFDADKRRITIEEDNEKKGDKK